MLIGARIKVQASERQEVSTLSRIELNDKTLLAYVGGQLSPDEVLAVESALAQDQDAKAIVAELRQCSPKQLRDAQNRELGKVLPPGLMQRIRQWKAAGPRSWRPPVQIGMVADQEHYAPEKLQDCDPTADEIRALEASLGSQLGIDLRVPNLDQLNLNFKRGRLLVTEGKPFAELLYLAAGGPVVAVCVFPSQDAIQEVTIEHAEGFNLVYWSTDGVGCVIIGKAASEYLHAAAAVSVSQLKNPQARDRLRKPQ